MYPGDTELAVAGFWHDIGHCFCTLDDDEHYPLMVKYDGEGVQVLGVEDHDRLGSELFQGVLPDRVCELINLHTIAKRYANQVNNTADRLSEASAATLILEGGDLSAQERLEFELNPLFTDAMKLREGDDAGKNPKFEHTDMDGNMLIGGRDAEIFSALRDTMVLHSRQRVEPALNAPRGGAAPQIDTR